MKKLSFAIGLAGIFAVASSAQATIPATQTLCISSLQPETNQTECEYRKPDDGAISYTNKKGESIRLPGTRAFKEMREGLDHKMCDAFLQEQENAHGKCKRVFWPRDRAI